MVSRLASLRDSELTTRAALANDGGHPLRDEAATAGNARASRGWLRNEDDCSPAFSSTRGFQGCSGDQRCAASPNGVAADYSASSTLASR